MPKNTISYILKNAIRQQQKVITNPRLIKPSHTLVNVCTWKDRNYSMKQITTTNSIDNILKEIVDDLNIHNFNINGTTLELNEMLYKLKELAKDPQYLYLVEDFLKEYPEYVDVIYPEIEDNK